jgi:hypothetical protein
MDDETQEIRASFPECVGEDSVVDYPRVTRALLRSLRELRAIVLELAVTMEIPVLDTGRDI